MKGGKTKIGDNTATNFILQKKIHSGHEKLIHNEKHLLRKIDKAHYEQIKHYFN